MRHSTPAVQMVQAVVPAEPSVRIPTVTMRAKATTEPFYQEKNQIRVGSALTPQYISAVLRVADNGRMEMIADMLDEVRETDPHLHSVLFKREAQVAGAPWEIRASRRARRSKRRDKVVDFCTEVLENLKGFAQVCAHLQSAVYHGRAVAENVWRRDGSKFIIDRIEPVHPRRLAYSADNWLLHLYDTSGGTQFAHFPGKPIDSFPNGKFIVHTPRVRGGYPTREGLGRVLVWYSVFKRWTQRDWMALAEMVGRPGRVGYYGTGNGDPAKGGMMEASPEDKALLESALDEWCSSVSVALPDTVRMDFTNLAGSGHAELHKVLADHCNAEMSKAALGETLTTEAGTRGARSLGDVHDDVRLMIAVWDARCLAETLRYCVLAPLVRLNFGETVPVPEIVFTVEPDENLNAKAERFIKLAQAGLNIGQAFARDEFGMPEPQPGEALMIPRSPASVDINGETPKPPPAAPATNDSVKDKETRPSGKTGQQTGGEEEPDENELDTGDEA